MTDLHAEDIVGEPGVVVDVQRLEDDLEVVLEVSGVRDDRLAVRVRVPRLLVHLHPARADQRLEQSSAGERRSLQNIPTLWKIRQLSPPEERRDFGVDVVDLVGVLALRVLAAQEVEPLERLVLHHFHALPAARLLSAAAVPVLLVIHSFVVFILNY